jgi:plastocyanin
MTSDSGIDFVEGIDDDDEDAEGSRKAITKGLFLASLALLAIAAVTVIIAVTTGDSSVSKRPSQTFTYVIPAGTGARVDLGDIPKDVFPDYLEVQVGDTISIQNQDQRSHVLGPFSVRAGEQFTYVFTEPGTYRGACTVHGDGMEAIVRVFKALAATQI